MKRLLALTITLLIVVSIHSFMMWRKAEEATEVATRVTSISERVVRTNQLLFAAADSCASTMAAYTLNTQARAIQLLDRKPKAQKTRIALNAADRERE